MAKKKPAKKKRTTTKKKSQQGSTNYTLLAIILVLIGGMIVYTLYQTDQLETPDIQLTRSQEEKSSQSSPDQDDSSQTNTSTSSKARNEQQKFSRKDIEGRDRLTEEVETNENLPEYSESEAYYYTRSFDFAWPGYDQDDNITEHEFYTLSYSEKHEQAEWVAYSLTRKNLKLSQFKSKDNFRIDPDIRSGSASPDDYTKSGYDRGHLAPAADFTWTEKGLDDSFYMSNITPQIPGFNRGIWSRLEGKVRDWANQNHKIYVVTGPIFQNKIKRLGKNKVEVPSAFYKVILDIEEPEIKAIGFILENKKLSGNVMNFAVTIDSVEIVTGFDFFPNIPDDLETNIESSINKRLWQ